MDEMTKKFKSEPDDFTEIHLIPYMHCDFSWTNSRKWHIWRYITGYKKALEIMREDPEYTYVLDNVHHSWLPFKKYCPELVDEFKQRVKEGRFIIANGGYALDRPNYNGYESFLRNVLAGRRYFENEFEIPEDESYFYFNADTGIGSSQLPQILKECGYRYYRSNRPSETMNHKGFPRQFRWKGLDGSEIIVARGDYGGFCFTSYLDDIPDFVDNWEKFKEAFWKTEGKQFNYSVTDEIMMFFGCDDVIPGCSLTDKPVPYHEVMDCWNEHEKARFFLSTPGKYFAKIEKEDLPTVEGVLDNCELSFVTIQKGEQALSKKCRLLERYLLKLEYLSSVRKAFGYEYDEKAISDIWTMLFDFSGHALEYAMKEDIVVLENEADEALMRVQRLIREAEEDIALAVDCENRPHDGETKYVIINPYPEEREEYVKIHVTTPHGLNGLKLYDTKGNLLPYQATEIFHADKAYAVQCNSANVVTRLKLPALGWETVTAITNGGEPIEFIREELDDYSFKLGQDENPVTVDNGAIVAEFEKGRLARVTEGGKTIEGNFGQIHFTESNPKSWCWLAFYNGDDYDMVPESWGMIKNGPLLWQYRIKGTLRTSKVVIDITIKKDSPRIDYKVTLDNEVNEGFFRASFPCDEDTTLYADVPYGVEKRNMETEPSFYKQPDMNDFFFWESQWRGQFYAINFALFKGQGRDSAIISDDCGIFYNLRPDQKKVSIVLTRQLDIEDKSDDKTASWVKLMSENHKTEGKHSFSFSYYLPGTDSIGDAIQKTELETKLLHFTPVSVNKFGYLPQGKLPLSASVLSHAGADCVITAFYSEDGVNVIRGYESRGANGTVTLELNRPVKSAFMADLKGDRKGDVTVDGNRITFGVRPWEIFSIRFE